MVAETRRHRKRHGFRRMRADLEVGRTVSRSPKNDVDVLPVLRSPDEIHEPDFTGGPGRKRHGNTTAVAASDHDQGGPFGGRLLPASKGQ